MGAGGPPAFRWRADDGLLRVVFGSVVKVGEFLDPRMCLDSDWSQVRFNHTLAFKVFNKKDADSTRMDGNNTTGIVCYLGLVCQCIK